MFNRNLKKYSYELSGKVNLLRMETLFKAILYNYDNTTNMKKYFTDINKYNMLDNEIKGLFFDRKMQKHPVIKSNEGAHDLCRLYGYEEYFYATKTVRNMFRDNLFDFEIKHNLKNLIETFNKFEQLPLVTGTLKEAEKIVKIDNVTDDLEVFTDGEILSISKDENGRTIFVSNPTFLIRKFEGDSYQIRFPAIIYGYHLNVELIPTIKDLLHSNQYKK